MSLAFSLYRGTTTLLEPLVPLLLRRRAARGKEDPARLKERLGHSNVDRPEGPLVWLHGASVGETLSALPLIERLGRERPDLHVLVTSGTTTSAELLGSRLPAFALHQYAPVDTPNTVRRFLDHWRPDALILLEGELWPNLLTETKARGGGLALVSARFTEKTADGWRCLRGTARRILAGFDLVFPQDDASARRLSDLGASVTGLANLKLVGAPLGHDPVALAALRGAVSDRRVIVSASTHPGEERLTDSAVASLPDRPLHLIAPRHPARADQIEAELILTGRAVARRSRGDPVQRSTDVYLADTLGELGLFFELADLILLGGGWAEGVGGHNPLEPARSGKAVLSGPSVSNWATVFETLAADQAVEIVAADDLAPALARLYSGPREVAAMGQRARRFATRQTDVLDRLWHHLSPLIPQ